MFTEKARLVWKGMKYYDRDLRKVCQHECDIFDLTLKEYSVSKKSKVIFIDALNVKRENKRFFIPFSRLMNYNIGVPTIKNNNHRKN